MENKIQKAPRSAGIARRGIRNTQDFAEMMSVLMSDIIDGRIDPKIANAAIKAGAQMLKVVEMQIQWGDGRANLELISSPKALPEPETEESDEENETEEEGGEYEDEENEDENSIEYKKNVERANLRERRLAKERL